MGNATAIVPGGLALLGGWLALAPDNATGWSPWVRFGLPLPARCGRGP